MWLGDMPMPEGATVDMMWAAYDALQEIEDRDEAIRMIAWYEDSKSKWEREYEYWKDKKDLPQYASKMKHIPEILKLIDEGIELYREKLV